MKIKHPIVLAFFGLCLWLLFWPSEKDHLNKQMAELCKKDGGLRIYEVVRVPIDAYSSGGVLKETNYRKISETESSVEIAGTYKMFTKRTVIKKGDPFKGEGNLQRDYGKIVRIPDGKLIAESIHYSRVGGDRWFAGMPSAENCPINDGNEADKIFIRDSE